MSNNQPGESNGGNETRNIGNPPGSPTQPVGGYSAPPPPPSGGNMPPQGGYTPPPPSGGYVPPQGGYVPPQGYAPPPSGGNPPPPGGYPLPPGGVANPTMDMKFSQGDFQRLFKQYQNVVMKYDYTVYGPEIAKANRKDIFLGVGMAGLANGIFAFLTTLLFYSFLGGFGSFGSFGMMAGSGIGGAVYGLLAGIIGTFITFFIGSYVTFFVAKQFFQGQGTDFWTHSYLLSLSYAPLRTATAILTIIPILGGLVGWLLRLYQYFHTGLAIQAYHRTDMMKGQLSVWIPVIAGAIVTAILSIIAAAIFVVTVIR